MCVLCHSECVLIIHFAGERYVMTFLNVLNFGDQGEYSFRNIKENSHLLTLDSFPSSVFFI